MPLGRRSGTIDQTMTGSPFEADQPDAPQEDVMPVQTDTPATDVPATPEVLAGVTAETSAKRGRPKLSDMPEIDLDALGDDDDVPEDEWANVLLADRQREGQPRSASQQKIDAAVAAVKAAWDAAGKPQLSLAPRKRYTVKPEFEATTRAMLTRAGVLHKVRVIQTTTHNGQGMAVIAFTAIDRPAKPEKTEQAEKTEK
jgi:hypothetical protein